MATVLVVDDAAAGRYATARILEAAGFEIREAATGRQALDLARQGASAMVLDIKLPDIDGFEVTQRVKTDELTARTSVVIKTAYFISTEDRLRGFALGADAYLIDPVDRELLVRTVRTVTSSTFEAARPTTGAVISHFLGNVGTAYCVECLARDLRLLVGDVEVAIARLGQIVDCVREGRGPCGRCARQRATFTVALRI
jgi:CheY-like chemotaxis protein